MQRSVPRTPQTEGLVRIGTILALPAVLEGLGADPAELLAEVGLDLELFEDPGNQIAIAARGHLISHCVARTGCRHLGLLLGQRASLQSFGLVGLLVRHSPDVATALERLVNYMHLHVSGAATALVVAEGTALLSYAIHQPRVEATHQIGDGAVAMMQNIMRELCGSGWQALEAWFAHGKPDDVQPFRRFFGAPLRFDTAQYAMLFSARCLKMPLPETDPELRRLLQAQVDDLEFRSGSDFVGQVRSVLRSALVTGHSSAEQVAALFSMHPRTLGRRLEERGTSFQALVDEGRLEIAGQMLAGSSLDIGRIATMLGYGRASTFTRAFRRWTGTAPSAWRRARRQEMSAATRAAKPRAG